MFMTSQLHWGTHPRNATWKHTNKNKHKQTNKNLEPACKITEVKKELEAWQK
jgi:hypothetical protein